MTLSEHFLFKEVSPVLCHVRCPCSGGHPSCLSLQHMCSFNAATKFSHTVRYSMEENTVQCVGLIIIVQTLPCVSQMCSLLEHFLNNCQPQVGLSTVISVLCTVSCVKAKGFCWLNCQCIKLIVVSYLRVCSQPHCSWGAV